MTPSRAEERFERKRARWVQRDLAPRGVSDPVVLAALTQVPRERFVPPELAEFAYDNRPLPIGKGQTISQPLMVAIMIQALELKGGERVLEIGAGSGYAAAVLSRIAGRVYTVERLESLAAVAEERLSALGYDNVQVLHADGTEGWPDHAPYDAIVVAAGAPDVPEPLIAQLSPGGRLVIPVGDTPLGQTLLRIRRDEAGGFDTEDLGPVRFVPLIGSEGWADPV
ncbi:MAG: protein-L-isoaspartate(D-aspartate) O-methyltransferase [Gemmatimonadetes bacterium]|nr:protein-L-isoaspartate(D-aspartate) O-methyltransferase [Gemmatimonadota bacterium]